MRISDWSSDVCSSDLGVRVAAGTPLMMLNGAANRDPRRFECPEELRLDRANAQSHIAFGREIGRASCRASVCQYVSLPVVPVSLNKIPFTNITITSPGIVYT